MRLIIVLFFVLLGLGPVGAQTPNSPPPPPVPSTNAPPRAKAVTLADLAAAADPATSPTAVPGGVNVHWFGHGFVYLTSSIGIRAAIDPFGPENVKYKFPVHLSSDFVLVTHESEDHCAAELLFGNPLIFRSVMAVGLQRANGINFYGVALQKNPNGDGGANTAYTIKFDGITFGYLGQINAPLLVQEKIQLGHIDVLFLPVGLNSLSVNELNQVAADVGARIIIPINYETPLSGPLALRSLGDYLSATKLPVRRFDSEEIVLTRSSLPEQPTIYLLKSP